MDLVSYFAFHGLLVCEPDGFFVQSKLSWTSNRSLKLTNRTYTSEDIMPERGFKGQLITQK